MHPRSKETDRPPLSLPMHAPALSAAQVMVDAIRGITCDIPLSMEEVALKWCQEPYRPAARARARRLQAGRQLS